MHGTPDLLGLRGLTAVVVGGAAGLGRAVSRRLAEAGCRVAVADIADEAGASVVEDIRKAGGAALYRHADARSRTDIRDVITAARSEFGPLAVAVNVVGNPGGTAGIKPFLDMTEHDMRARLELNFLTTFVACQEEALAMIEDGASGRIVNFGSSSGLVGAANVSGYGAAKAAVAHFTSRRRWNWPATASASTASCPVLKPTRTPACRRTNAWRSSAGGPPRHPCCAAWGRPTRQQGPRCSSPRTCPAT
ncbi:MAG: SDR family NAD(P)-dependent oxidoreductase [Streptomycetaceae bacterium]|nr:SDR family NAD(P)-dependent oxidoreductase [Streptomycetaceae bacterium]